MSPRQPASFNPARLTTTDGTSIILCTLAKFTLYGQYSNIFFYYQLKILVPFLTLAAF